MNNYRQEYYIKKEDMIIHSFYICEGVELAFYDLKMLSWMGEEKVNFRNNVIEINHCIQGRYECEFADDSYYYLGEDCLAVSRLSDKKNTSGFPLGVYKGINILIDLDKCGKEFFDLLRLFEINPCNLVDKWKGILPCKIFQESKSVAHIFNELYTKENTMGRGYGRIKLIELMMLFEKYEFGIAGSHQHFRKSQVEKVKHIKEHLEECLDEEVTLSDLAREHDISESSIKRCFKAIYGNSPSRYRKEFRMQKAACDLISTDRPISDIGMQVGYYNPSKFSSAFYSVMGKTPSEYRNGKNTH